MLTKQVIGLNLWSYTGGRVPGRRLGPEVSVNTFTASDWFLAPSVPKGLTQSMPSSTTSEEGSVSSMDTRSGSVLSLMYPSKSSIGNPFT